MLPVSKAKLRPDWLFPILLAGAVGTIAGLGGAKLAVRAGVLAEDASLPDGYRSFGSRLPAEAHEAIELLRHASDEGLTPAPALLTDIERGLSQGDEAIAARAERKLAHALGRYAYELRVPRVATGTVYVDPELAPQAVDLGSSAAKGAIDRLRHVQDRNPLYTGLKSGLAWYRARWSQLPYIALRANEPLAIGSSGTAVAMLRQRLGLPRTPAIFDNAVGEAVRRFRVTHGIGDATTADRATLAALNLGAAHYERLIALNMDRVRGLPVDGRRYILVDAAGARLRMIDDGAEVDSMRVIVGKPGMETPQLAGLIRFAIFDPYWNVPPDLVQHSIAPAVGREGAGYLARRGFLLFSGWRAETRDIDPAAVDWSAVASGTQKVWIRQAPGGDNMMGEVKFMLPNRLGIYLHDTPRKTDFARADRRLSSGCVRLEDAGRLTRWLFGDHPAAAAAGTPDRRVDLASPMPVFITYLTALPERGEVRFQPDVYRRDRMQLASFR